MRAETIEEWLGAQTRWAEEAQLLRELMARIGLTETLKWGQPTYMDQERNILLLSRYTDWICLAFFKGSLLDDPQGILVAPGENSRHVRQLRFQSIAEIQAREGQIIEMIQSALEVERLGLSVPPPPEDEGVEELYQRFEVDPELKEAFEALTPGRRRAYHLHFSQPKQSMTRTNRIERCAERIMAGRGLQDCICGKSKRMPRCDGSHKSAR